MWKAVLKITLFAVIAVVVIGVLVVAASDAVLRGKLTICRNNLRNLGSYIHDEGQNVESIMKDEGKEARSRAYWFKLVSKGEWEKPVKNATGYDFFICPLTGKAACQYGAAETVDYRAPRKNPLNYQKNEPLAADRIGNHGAHVGGYVLLMDWSLRGGTFTVSSEAENSALWRKAEETTSD